MTWHSRFGAVARKAARDDRRRATPSSCHGAAWGSDGLAALFRRVRRGLAFPVALAAAAAGHSIRLGTAEAASLAFVSNLVSAALRLGPIGQTDAQTDRRAVAAVAPRGDRSGGTATLDDLGSATLRSDIAVDATRNPIFEAVPIMTKGHPHDQDVQRPARSASAGPSAPARRR